MQEKRLFQPLRELYQTTRGGFIHLTYSLTKCQAGANGYEEMVNDGCRNKNKEAKH